jgi:beta-lactam-binding protein with PASTA domain
MPDLIGQNAAVAQDTLKRAGFTNVTLGSADPKDKLVVLPQNWKITEQSTPGGTTVQSDTLIVLTCSKKS